MYDIKIYLFHIPSQYMCSVFLWSVDDSDLDPFWRLGVPMLMKMCCVLVIEGIIWASYLVIEGII